MSGLPDRIITTEAASYAIKHGIGKGAQGRVKLGINPATGEVRMLPRCECASIFSFWFCPVTIGCVDVAVRSVEIYQQNIP